MAEAPVKKMKSNIRLTTPRGILLSIVMVLVFSLIAEAHESRPAYLELTQTSDESYDILWKVPAKSPSQRLSLNLRFSEEIDFTTMPTRTYVNAAYVESASVQRSGGLEGMEIYVEGLSGTMTDVLVRQVRLDGTTLTSRLTPDKPYFVFDAVPSSLDVSRTYTILGIQHIFEGIDHLLFVACLLIVAGIGRRLLITITGFTLAHSVTLALATLDIIRLPIPPVEAVIALSVVFLATEIARGDKQGLTYKYPVAVSISFGLLHGFGFAAVLNEIGLPLSDLPLALLFFNVGVELGQLMFIALLIAAFKVVSLFAKGISKGRFQSPISTNQAEIMATYIIGTVASYWLIERVVGFWI
jgi:hydrogenase/urease accessory protein HupE